MLHARLLSSALLALLCAAGAPRPSQATVDEWQARRFGMFIHWGLYSVAGGVWNGQPVRNGYSEQIQGEAKIARADYEKLTASFNPVKWDADAVVALAKAAGMKFIVITSKHHDGFSMFHTGQNRYNVVDSTPYGKDVVKQLAEACRRGGIRFGVYYSTIDWHDERATPSDGGRNNNEIPKAHEEFNVAQLRELMSNYGPLSEIWFDMGKPTPEQSRRFTDTVHGLQPECMVSGRVFNHQGDFTVMGDNRIPEYVIDEPWQTPGSIYHETWGYRSWQPRDDLAGKTNEHITKLVEVASRGGNYILNIGPRGDGSLVEFEADVLKGMGRWLEVNGEAIYNTQAQPFRKLDFGHATLKPGRLYLLVRSWPADGKLRLPGLETPLKRAYLLADPARKPLALDNASAVRSISVTGQAAPAPVTVVVAEFDGKLEVKPPTLKADAAGALTLGAAEADKFYNYNGMGYYERPSVYKLAWNFEAPAGRYSWNVEPRMDGVEVRVDGVAVGQADLRLGSRGWHTLTIEPKRPYAKGERLEPLPERVTLGPAH